MLFAGTDDFTELTKIGSYYIEKMEGETETDGHGTRVGRHRGSLVTTTTSIFSRGRRFSRITSVRLPFLDLFEVRQLEIWRLPRPIRAIAEWSEPKRARNWDGREAQPLEDYLLAGRVAWKEQMTPEGLGARELAFFLRFWARSRAGPLFREVSVTMLHAGARFLEGPETVVNAAVQILFRILGASARARRYLFCTIVGTERRRGIQLLAIAGFGHGGDLVYGGES